MTRTTARFFALSIFVALHDALGQGRTLRVVSTQGTPVPFATVWIEGGNARIADSTGTVAIGNVNPGTVKVESRRMGFVPFKGTFTVHDTTRLLTVRLEPTVNQIAAVNIIEKKLVPLGLQGFYRRALDRQNGAGSGWFIGPEEIERRQPNLATDVMREFPGLQFRRDVAKGAVVAVDRMGCEATVVVDGSVINPHPGKKSQSLSSGMATAGGRWDPATAQNSVSVDSWVSPEGLAAVEFYKRGANIPMELQGNDMSCGMLVIWTGGRKP
jgi:hypothetical protein